MIAAKRKEHPLSMRLPEADITVIDRAAALRGRSRTDFVREAAVRAAEEVVLEQTLVRMSEQGFAAFVGGGDGTGATRAPAGGAVPPQGAVGDAGRVSRCSPHRSR